MTKRRIMWIAFNVGFACGRAAQVLQQSALIATGMVLALLGMWGFVIAVSMGWLPS